MRERWARLIALLTGVMVLLLSAGFSVLQNPVRVSAATEVAKDSATPPTGTPAEVAALGRALFDQHDCTRCHSIEGHGSPRSPLDGVGSRLSREEIRHWMIGDDAVKDDLSPRALAAKKPYAGMPEAELQALLDYLQAMTE